MIDPYRTKMTTQEAHTRDVMAKRERRIVETEMLGPRKKQPGWPARIARRLRSVVSRGSDDRR
jgi:hypothetical protein